MITQEDIAISGYNFDHVRSMNWDQMTKRFKATNLELSLSESFNLFVG